MRAPVLVSLLLSLSLGKSQQIVSVAGLPPNHRNVVDGVAAIDAPLNNVYGIIRDRNTGRLLIHDQYLVERFEADGTLLAFAGTGHQNRSEGDTADGTPTSNWQIGILRGMAQDASGVLYLADAGAGRVYRVGLDGLVTRFAGVPFIGNARQEVEGLRAANLPLTSPRGLAFDSRGNLYISDVACQCIRRVDSNGISHTLYMLPPTQPFLYFEGLAVDSNDNVYAAVYSGHEILRITPDGKVTTIAGTGVPGFSGDGGPATLARLQYPSDLAVAADGSVYVSDTANHRIRRIRTDGSIDTVAGTGRPSYGGDGGPALSAAINMPAQLLLDPDGTLYIAEFGDGRVRRITPNGIIGTIAGNGTFLPGLLELGDGGPAIAARVARATATVVDSFGNLYIADSDGFRVRKIAPDGIITTVAGHGVSGNTGDGGPAIEASLGYLLGLGIDAQNNLYLTSEDGRVRKVDTGGTISLVAGAGFTTLANRFQGDGGPAVNATLVEPKGVAVDAAGNVYIADTTNARLRMVDRAGIIHLVAAADTSLIGLEYWNAVAIDPQGGIYVAITRVPPTGLWSTVSRVNADGSLTAVAGNQTKCLSNVLDGAYDGRQATTVPLCIITGLTFDAQGNLYIPETFYGAILKMMPDGTISRIAGTLNAPTLGDGGPAISASLTPPNLALDGKGNIFFPDSSSSRLREITPTPVTLKPSRDRLALQGAQTIALDVVTNFAEPFPYTVRIDDAPWLSSNRTSGQTGERLQISSSTRGLAPGTYQGTIHLTLLLPTPQQADVPVTLTVQ